ncbi:OsmC family peroxiredoxin [Streptomyces sp. ISID311]|uniref:OsmC family peroxiredoxin n=1 Tax=Streptomyces sp. ISID311 TaxID=2601673 RepID=UPI00164AF1CB|nr:OsmC family peroxiredoxin [Streptomyces sp. ISID311]
MTLDESQIDAQMQSMAAKLRTARFERGMRLIDVANMTGLSEVHLYRLEQGERAPSLRALLVLAAAFGLEPAELLTSDDGLPSHHTLHTGRAVWAGTEKSGSGVMIKGGVRVEYDLAHRSNPLETPEADAAVGSPEALLGMAFAGCFSMALAADLDGAGFEPVRIETFARVQTEVGASGVTPRAIELICEAVVPEIADVQFQPLAENVKRNCLVARALAAVPARLDARLMAIREADGPDETSGPGTAQPRRSL